MNLWWYSMFTAASTSFVYVMGYFRFSPAWILAALGTSYFFERRREKRNFKLKFNQMLATTEEKEILMKVWKELPAWVFFADMERAEWINRMIKRLWPFVGHYVKKLLEKQIEPQVAETLKAYKINSFRFLKTNLGNVPPRVGGVKTYGHKTDRKEVVIDMEITYAGDCEFEAVASGIGFGITDVQLKGMMRIVLRPLLRDLPIVGGVQAFFLNPPSLDFNMTNVANLLEMPGLGDLIRETALQQINAMIVVPNKYVFSLSDQVSLASLRIPDPHGALRILVLEAKGLENKDISILKKGKSDPYAKIQMGAFAEKTHTLEDTLNPVWNYCCEAPTYVGTSDTKLEIDLYDYDSIGPAETSEEFLGRAVLDVATLAGAGTYDDWVTLEDVKSGKLHLKVEWMNFSANPADLPVATTSFRHMEHSKGPGPSVAVVYVYLDSAKNLPGLGAAKLEPEARVRINVGTNSVLSAVCTRTFDPVWEETHTFFVKSITQNVEFTVEDRRTGKSLGTVSIPLADVLAQDNLEMFQMPFPVIREKLKKTSVVEVAPELVVTLRLRLLIPGNVAPDVLESITQTTDGKEEEPAELPETDEQPETPVETNAITVRKQDSVRSGEPNLPPVSVSSASAAEPAKPPPTTVALPASDRPSAATLHAPAETRPEPEPVVTKPHDTVSSSSAASLKVDSSSGAPPSPALSGKTISSTPKSTDGKMGLESLMKSALSPVSMASGIEDTLRHRSITAGARGLGRIQLSLRFVPSKSKLMVVLHKCVNLPMEPSDENELPDPYAKVSVLPDRRGTKQKTTHIKDERNPVFDITFEFNIGRAELCARTLEIVILSKKGKVAKLFHKSPVLGSLRVPLGQLEDVEEHKMIAHWFDLGPAVDEDDD